MSVDKHWTDVLCIYPHHALQGGGLKSLGDHGEVANFKPDQLHWDIRLKCESFECCPEFHKGRGYECVT